MRYVRIVGVGLALAAAGLGLPFASGCMTDGNLGPSQVGQTSSVTPW